MFTEKKTFVPVVRILCSCGNRKETPATFDDAGSLSNGGTALKAFEAEHVKPANRKAKKDGKPEDHHVRLTLSRLVDAVELEAEDLESRKQWTVRVRDRGIPMAVEELVRKAKAVASDLREMADRVARSTTFHHMTDLDDVTRVVSEIQHTVLWGVANLNLDELSSRLRELESKRREVAEMANQLPPAEADPKHVAPCVDCQTTVAIAPWTSELMLPMVRCEACYQTRRNA